MNQTLFAKLIAFTAFSLSLVMLFNVSADGIRYNAAKTFITAYAIDDETDNDDEIIGYDDFTPDDDEEDMSYTTLLPMVFDESSTELIQNEDTGAVNFTSTYMYERMYHIGIQCAYIPPENGNYDGLSSNPNEVCGPRFSSLIITPDNEEETVISSAEIVNGHLVPTIYMVHTNYYPNTYSETKSFKNLLYAIISEDEELLERVLQDPYQEIDTDEIEENLQIDLSADVDLNRKINVNDDNEVSVMSLGGWLTSLIVVAAVIVAYVIVTQVAEQIRAADNFSFNETLETPDKNGNVEGLSLGTYIEDQTDPHVAVYQFGFTTFDKVGCEVAAIYNLMIDLGEPKMLSDVIYDFEKWAIEYAFAWGNFGSEPRKLYRYLKDKDISYKKYTSYKKYQKAVSVTDSDHYISSFWNKPITNGLHTFYIRRDVTVTEDTTTTLYTAYNWYSPRPKETADFNVLKESCGNFIVGYIIL